MPAPAQDNNIMSTHGASRLARQTTAQAPRQAAARASMLKLALRILVVATIGYILATQFVSLSYLLEPITADLVRDAARPMRALRTELDPQPPAEREAYLRDHIKPHYGLGLQTPAQAADPRRAGHSEKVRIVMRDD